jgi:hypothetical protein
MTEDVADIERVVHSDGAIVEVVIRITREDGAQEVFYVNTEKSDT